LEHDADTPLYRLSETQMAAIGYLKVARFSRTKRGCFSFDMQVLLLNSLGGRPDFDS
jgi:hypothetical protein